MNCMATLSYISVPVLNILIRRGNIITELTLLGGRKEMYSFPPAMKGEVADNSSISILVSKK